jgi:hypothetical protein
MATPLPTDIIFAPGPAPTDPGKLARYVQDTIVQLQNVVALLPGYMKPLYAAPAKPVKGRLYYADGVSWDPGSGEGVYRYTLAGVWAFVG